ncbi:MAG: tRNA (adenosine(37)-N6)-threonylcarbamoyltransferase complex transferase subunit TsaD [Vampirovibrionia bacterium]
MAIIDLYKPLTKQKVSVGPEVSTDQYILGLETSCDETAAAIVLNGRKVLSNVVSSQIDIHQVYGGVVPEVAAREHLESINIVIDEALKQAQIKPDDLTAVASTVGPGLVGALLVGVSAAKALCFAKDIPFIGVNHLKAHVCANYLDTDLEPPFICLLVSGGHTQIIIVKSYGTQEILGQTLDDAAGEAYDKVARLMDFPYPGGPNLDKAAKEGDMFAYQLPVAKVEGYNFSFSGLKTAVLRLMQQNKGNINPEDFSASFQEVMTETLLAKTLKASDEYGIKTLVLAGGVAANSGLRAKFLSLDDSYKVFVPPLKYCTDNAAMVASAGYFVEGYYNLDFEVFSRGNN